MASISCWDRHWLQWLRWLRVASLQDWWKAWALTQRVNRLMTQTETRCTHRLWDLGVMLDMVSCTQAGPQRWHTEHKVQG